MIQYVQGMTLLQSQKGEPEHHYLDRLGPLEEDWFMLLHNLL